MTRPEPRSLSRMLATLAVATTLGVVGFTACGSDSEGDQPSTPDSTVALTKNGVLRTTTTVPPTIQPRRR